MNGFYVLKTIPEAISRLPKKEQQEASWAVMVYGSTGELPQDLSPAVQALMTLICPAMDSANKQSAASRENGKKGGRPKKEENPSETQEEKSGNPSETQGEPEDNLSKTQGEPIENPSETQENLFANRFEIGFPLPPTPPNPKQVTSNKREGTPLTPLKTYEKPIFDGVMTKPSLEAVILIARDQGMSESEARKFYAYYDAQGWKFSNGLLIEDVPSALMRWNVKKDEFSKPEAKRPSVERKYTDSQLAEIEGSETFDDIF